MDGVESLPALSGAVGRGSTASEPFCLTAGASGSTRQLLLRGEDWTKIRKALRNDQILWSRCGKPSSVCQIRNCRWPRQAGFRVFFKRFFRNAAQVSISIRKKTEGNRLRDVPRPIESPQKIAFFIPPILTADGVTRFVNCYARGKNLQLPSVFRRRRQTGLRIRRSFGSSGGKRATEVFQAMDCSVQRDWCME